MVFPRVAVVPLLDVDAPEPEFADVLSVADGACTSAVGDTAVTPDAAGLLLAELG